MSALENLDRDGQLGHSRRGLISALCLGVGTATLGLNNDDALAAPLALYDFGTVEAPSWASSDVDASSVATPIAPAAGLGSSGSYPNTLNGIYTGTGAPAPAFAQKPLGANKSTQAQAYATDAYLGFTITPATSFELDLTSFAFHVASYNNDRRFSYYVASSIDGYDTPIAPPEEFLLSTDKEQLISLADSQFQDVSVPVTFRIYMWDYAGLGGSSGSRWELDNITLNGSAVLVPEPAAIGLAALGSVLALGRRRPRG